MARSSTARVLNYSAVSPEGCTDDDQDEDGIGTNRLTFAFLAAVGLFAASFAGAFIGSSSGIKSGSVINSGDSVQIPTSAMVPAADVAEDSYSRGEVYSTLEMSDSSRSSSLAMDMTIDEARGEAGIKVSSVLGFGGEGMCSTYQCGGDYIRGRSCQCTEECDHYDNCCADYHTYCKSHAPAPALPGTYGQWDCLSNLDMGDVTRPEKKGLAIDDTTFENCADQVPTHWPNTNQKVLSVRLFKPWGMTDPKFFRGDRHKAWQGLKGFAEASGAKFLIGVSVTCRTQNDDKEWEAGREFIKYIGENHILGLAVGNEIDLQVGASNGACVNNLWNQGGYLRILKKRVAEFEALSPKFKRLPVTAVLSMFSMNGYPFKYTVSNFLKGAWETYGERFKFSINIYPQFSGGLARAGCGGAINIGTKFSADHPAGFIPAVLLDIQKRLTKIGAGDMRIWLGEHGWATQAYCVLCGEACHSKAVQSRYYRNFLKWDMSASDVPTTCGEAAQVPRCAASVQWAKTEGIYGHPTWYPGLTNASSDRDFQIYMAKQDNPEARGGCPFPCDTPEAKQQKSHGLEAEHAFYFTLRDSFVFGRGETFGVLEQCGNKRCKFQK